MKATLHWERAALLVVALAVAGQAHASGGQSGPGGNGTGGPQVDPRTTGSTETPAAAPRGTDGMPVWYSVNGIVGAQPPPQRTQLTQRSLTVPRWYAVR